MSDLYSLFSISSSRASLSIVPSQTTMSTYRASITAIPTLTCLLHAHQASESYCFHETMLRQQLLDSNFDFDSIARGQMLGIKMLVPLCLQEKL